MSRIDPQPVGAAPGGGDADYLIIGGGSAGCVLACRLSADPSVQVVMIEAGKDAGTTGLPERVRDPGVRTVFAFEYFWPDAFAQVTSGATADSTGRVGMTMLARAVGGGSLVNGLQAGRGLARDYDEWQDFGVRGWSAQDVLPYFKKVETDLDYRNPQHGEHGPIHIQRVGDRNWSALSRALRVALENRGLPRVEDFNDWNAGEGVGPVPLNFGAEGRMSTANAYLTPEVRRRPNLKIITETQVSKVVFEAGRVVGAECEHASGNYRVRCANAIICSGAINSPALLQRSGIGAGAELTEYGISVVSDRPGVGLNLQNHALFSVNVLLRRAGRCKGLTRIPSPMVVRYSSKERDCPPTDMFINVWERALGSQKSDPLGRQVADLMLQLNKGYSVGEVRLQPAHPLGMPRVRFNLLQDPRDRRRMAAGLQFILTLLRDPAVAPLVNDVFQAKFTPLTMKLMQDTREARILSRLGAVALDGPAILRRHLLKDSITPLAPAEDGREAERLVHENVIPAGHSVGTCRMGEQSDSRAVIDSRCRVFGVHGLRVVDASIFPTIMTAGTNLPVMMAAEKAADMIIEDRRSLR